MMIVTGSPRAGTSLVMQTLKIFGLPIEGAKFHEDFPIVEGNPKGYYDIPFQEQIDAAKNGGFGDKYEGKVVKLFGESLLLADPSIVTHIIVCKRRDTGAQDRSCMKLIKQEREFDNDSEIRNNLITILKDVTLEQLAYRRDAYNHMIETFLSRWSGYSMDVYLEDMRYNTVATLTELQDFFDAGGKKELKKAIENVGE